MALFGNNIFAAQSANTTATANNSAVSNPIAPKAEPQTEPNADPIVKNVDVLAMMSHLRTNGSVKLSDFATTVESSTPTKTTPQPENSSLTPTPAPTAPVKTDRVPYTAPQSAEEAKQRIVDAKTANRIHEIAPDEEGNLQFVGKTFALQQAFRMLGGQFDKTTQVWTVSPTYWAHPEECAEFVDAELNKQQRRDENNAKYKEKMDAEIEKRLSAEKAKWEAEWNKTHTAGAAPEGYITLEQAKANTAKAIKAMLAKLATPKDENINAIIKVAFAS